jgi:hypothetical protein
MKALVISVLLFASAAANANVFQSHGQDGKAYWVAQCGMSEECFETAYQWCDKGPYVPLDKGTYLITTITFQFRFVCQKPHKLVSNDCSAVTDPDILAAFPEKCKK